MNAVHARTPEIMDCSPLISTHRNITYFKMLEFYNKFGGNYKFSHDLIFLGEEELGGDLIGI
jgi:hypothetical protein